MLGYLTNSSRHVVISADPPQIYSQSANRTIISGNTAVLPCRHKQQPSAIVKWQIQGRVIAIKQANGRIL
jgi:hypothetical protein